MQISITGQHVEITQALRTYIENKFSRLQRHFDNMTIGHVILSVEKERQMVEATIHVSGGKLFAEAQHDDMYAAIDDLADKLDRQLKRHKEKLTNHHRGEPTLKNQEIS